ncbi:hypothetical protein ACTA71_004800 [Dictyostelium dimigraforme]
MFIFGNLYGKYSRFIKSKK